MTPNSPTVKPKRISALGIASWAIFGILSFLIIQESATPGNASGAQSGFLSQMIAAVINAVTPGKVASFVQPDGISLEPLEGLQQGNTAIIGTTRMLSYRFSAPQEATVDSSVELKREDGSSDEDYTATLTPTARGGVVRILPYRLKEGCKITLTDVAGHAASFAFDVVELQSPEDISCYFPSKLNIGQAIPLEGYLESELNIAPAEGEDRDHYLRRFYDTSKLNITSTNPEVVQIDDGRIVPLSSGRATLCFGEKELGAIEVNNEVRSPVPSFQVAPNSLSVGLMDYDYPSAEVGATIVPTFPSGYEDEPLIYESSDPMIARVTPDRYENVAGDIRLVRGGKVEGYRLAGKAKIRVYPASNPSLAVDIPVTNAPAALKALDFSLQDGNESIASGQAVSSGATLIGKGVFTPPNFADKRIEAVSSNPSVLQVNNARGETVSITAKQAGKATITLTSVFDPTQRKTYEITVGLQPTIAPNDMAKFEGYVRKAVGHFGLFLVTGVFGMLAFASTLRFKKKTWLWAGLICLASGLLLAGLSEAIQLIPSLHRSGQIDDAAIDLAGYAVGMIISGILYYLIKAKRDKKKTIIVAKKDE